MMPVGTASPKAWAAWSTSPQVAPPSTRTVCAIRVDADTPHLREVYHQPVVGHAQAPAIVPATAYGQEHLIVAGEVHAADDVGHIGAAHYHTRALVDHGVVDLASFIVTWITGLDELSTQARLELLYGRFIDHDGSPFLEVGRSAPPRSITETILQVPR